MTTRTERPCPVVLIVVDGFGYGPKPEADAIAAAEMPRWRTLLTTWPNSRLDASALAVGLPEGQMGNSEVGHLNIGAGRPVLQDLPRIDGEIADGTFRTNEVVTPVSPLARLRVEKTADGLHYSELSPVRFVPLLEGVAEDVDN